MTAAAHSRTLTLAQARRIALAAQGFAEPRPTGRVDRRHVRRVFDRVGLIQIDSVNVLARSHELVPFSRLGPYPRDLLRTMTGPELFEYWGHEASLIPVDQHPLYRFKMAAAANGEAWGGLVRLFQERPGYVAAVLDEVRERGPLAAGELSDPGDRSGPWWGWHHGKQALEYLFWTGQVTARRRPSFEREYDLPERVLPPAVLEAPTPPDDEARAGLLERAARALGVATYGDLADYHRLNQPKSRPALDALVAAGRLEPVRVEGWRQPAYLHPEARIPRRVEARALVSPFDSLVWGRPRAERLFDFRFRLEIYTPAHKRVHGYYVLPFLLGDRLVARVDLKADRQAGVLRAHAAHAEPGVHAGDQAGFTTVRVATELAAELRLLASWLDLADGVAAGHGGDLAWPLRHALRS